MLELSRVHSGCTVLQWVSLLLSHQKELRAPMPTRIVFWVSSLLSKTISPTESDSCVSVSGFQSGTSSVQVVVRHTPLCQGKVSDDDHRLNMPALNMAYPFMAPAKQMSALLGWAKTA
jgi:hypothetical protein